MFSKLESLGWAVETKELPARKPHGQREKDGDNPGFRVVARKPGRAPVAVEVRDWSEGRRRIEATVLLASKLSVPVAEELGEHIAALGSDLVVSR